MKNRVPGAVRPLKYVSTLLLALASSSAMALGLGDIRVLSKPGQPLLAEIPVISADPSELENLRVALASPATFARVGLEPPSGLVSELQFELTRNAQGRAVVRVSSQAPVATPSLNFLIEADWGQGRLVREYSALVDAPNSAAAVAEPEIVAPAGAMSNAIIREPAPEAAAVAAPSRRAEAAAAPRPATPRPVQSAPAGPVAADGSVTVQRGQTLSQIAGSLAREQGINRDQAMIALLRANPEAFIRGNVNLLKQGAVLRTPGAEGLAGIDAQQAAAIVREHTAQWRQSRAAIPQPADSGVAAVPSPAPAAPTAAGQGARLEIAPAVAAGTTAGTTTGTAAGTEGDMLGNEQLRQAKEDVATRDAEIQELRERVAELEKLKAQQQSLITMKDNDLAAAQQRLEQAPGTRDSASGGWYWLGLIVLLLVVGGWALVRRRKPSPLPPLSRDGLDGTASAAAVPAADYVDELAEQRDDAHRAPDEEAIAEADVYAGLRREPVFSLAPSPHDAEPHDPLDDPRWSATATDDAPVLPEVEATAASAYGIEADAQHVNVDEALFREPAPLIEPPAHALEAAAQPSFRGVFEFPDETATAERAADASEDSIGADVEPLMAVHDDTTDGADPVADNAPVAPIGSPGRDRLELAIAYLDLGDAETARTLLQEVAVGADPHSQAEARELLARLG
ncbi:fimbrial protein FimV [Stenotrophomonas sp. SRS1]|uniref:FimV/HubP family polar landmark protein n=1 Tax=Stenotrophomonas sp. SRS1 TaxID=2870345 RepID=UPI0022374AE5|nr:FimV/HubP family polar landmark protein [Stenotrophomonas sp. SRS1]MCW6027465.1 fimbrial protein FimV [Stenotrophomonas sp. SRS1]